MSYICWMKYRGIIKDKYRVDMNRAVQCSSWEALQNHDLEVLLLDNNIDIKSKKFDNILNDNIEYSEKSGMLNIEYFWDCSGEKSDTDRFIMILLPFITKDILIYCVGNDFMVDNDREPYVDVISCFKQNMME